MRGYAVVALHNPKSAENVGGVFRAAFIYSAAMVVIAGGRIQNYSKKIKTDTPCGWKGIPVVRTNDLFAALPVCCIPIAIEITKDAVPLPKFNHPECAFYIFGPEDGAVPDNIRERCQKTVFVPTNYCMNLAATVNVVLYDRLAKALTK